MEIFFGGAKLSGSVALIQRFERDVEPWIDVEPWMMFYILYLFILDAGELTTWYLGEVLQYSYMTRL